MSYHVHWPERIRRRLLDFYAQTVQGTGQGTAELNAALAVVEEALQRTPGAAGESRVGDVRVLIVPPLSVEFQVSESAGQVDVLRVHYSRGRRA